MRSAAGICWLPMSDGLSMFAAMSLRLKLRI